ncbi:Acyl-[acyl-carrier-protein]--UDP-N-acetylglucosamine O-acyltransferase [Bienertia sinuspersici]
MAFDKRKKQFLDSSNVIEEQPLYNESESIHVQNENEPAIEELISLGLRKGKIQGRLSFGFANTAISGLIAHILKSIITSSVIHQGNDIQRCQKMTTDQEAYRRLRNKVQQIEEAGTSSYLRSSNLTARDMPKPNTIVDAFATMDREAVDMKIMR